MEEITVITCYNDKIKYDAFLETLYAQDIPFAVRGIDNTAKQFPSCASALNYAIKDVKTEYVVFAHQDILLPGCSMLRDFLDAMKNSEPGSILGVAGKVPGQPQAFSCILHGQSAETLYNPGTGFDGLVEVQTLDECFFGGESIHFKDNPFDESLCNGWHLYAAEQCLRNIKNGRKVYACSIPLVHLSVGHPDRSFYKCFFRLCTAYSSDFDYITTGCAWGKTKIPGRWLLPFNNIDFVMFKERLRGHRNA